MEQNKFMQALNGMKAALSEIEKEYTAYQGTMTGKQDGNMGNAQDGQEGYSKMQNPTHSAEFEQKKKMLIASLPKG